MDNLKKRPLVKFRRPAVLYALLLVFALIFTQALRATASAGGGASSRGRRGRGRDRNQEKNEEAESGVVTNPETTPILVRMKLSAYDFGRSRAHVETMLDEAAKDAAAGAAKDAATPSQKEGK